ncbi:MAG: hypothetical protein EBT93_06405 [Alphaproteobacteria bacterium]|nr:hypothetical protein [Alphaproteobacteria bacterium]
MADVSFFSPYAVGGATRPDSFTNLNPLMRSRLMEMLMAAKEELGPDALRITSAYRSPELQGQLYQEALKKYGTPEETRRWVAPAGRSQHNFGTAVDFANLEGQLLRDPNSPEAKWLKANAAKFGLAVPLSNEPWQVELEGARSGNISQGQQMRLSTKDAQMTPMDQKKPETLWGRLTNTSERSGLNPLEAFASALDPLIMPELRAGGAIREMGAQRAALAKEDKTKNATLNELRKRAASGDKIAQRYIEAIGSGALDARSGFSGYLNEAAQEQQFQRTQAAAQGKTTAAINLQKEQAEQVAKYLEAQKRPDLASIVRTTPSLAGEVMGGLATSAMTPKIGYTQDQVSIMGTLRDDLRTDTQNYKLISEGYERLKSFYENPNAVTDYALAVAFAKILDPTSVARESEVDAVANAGAKIPALGKALKNVVDGEGKLTEAVRQQIAEAARREYLNIVPVAQNTLTKYEDIAKKAGLTIDDIYAGPKFEIPDILVPAIIPQKALDAGLNQEDWTGMDVNDKKEFL